MNNIGVTATRHGATHWQLEVAIEVLIGEHEYGSIIHHGACLGGDEQLSIIGRSLGYRLYSHPSNLGTWQSTLAHNLSVFKNEPFPPLERNRHIVNVSKLLIALPRSNEEELRSGTWFTICYAKGKEIPTIIIQPDGSIKDD